MDAGLTPSYSTLIHLPVGGLGSSRGSHKCLGPCMHIGRPRVSSWLLASWSEQLWPLQQFWKWMQQMDPLSSSLFLSLSFFPSFLAFFLPFFLLSSLLPSPLSISLPLTIKYTFEKRKYFLCSYFSFIVHRRKIWNNLVVLRNSHLTLCAHEENSRVTAAF